MTSILSQQKLVLKATKSNAIIYKHKNIFSFFFGDSEMSIKFWTVWKNLDLIADVLRN